MEHLKNILEKRLFNGEIEEEGGTGGGTGGSAGGSAGGSVSGSSGGSGSNGGTSTSGDGSGTTNNGTSNNNSNTDSTSDDSSENDKGSYGFGGVFRGTFNKKYKCPAGFKKQNGICVQKKSQLTEEPIGNVSHKLNVRIIIDKSAHASQRQNRHEGKFIDDQQIKAIAHRATKKFITYMIYDKIDIEQEVHVKDSKSNINLIATMKHIDNQLIFRVITIMDKPNFKAKKGTLSIEV